MKNKFKKLASERIINFNKKQKGKTWEERFGEEKAKEMKIKIGLAHKGNKYCLGKESSKKGKSWEQIYGKKEARMKKEKLSSSQLGNKNFLGHKHSDETKKLIGKKNEGTFEEKYGEEKANKMKIKMSKIHKGMLHTEESKEKISLSHIGKKHSEETKEKLRCPKSEEHKKNMRKTWKIEEIRNSRVKATLKNRKIYPNEQRLLNIIRKNNFPFNYVGNGKAVFNGYCPDFLSKNPKHIIELFGGRHFDKKGKIRDKKRMKAYTSLGYKVLIIQNWEFRNEDRIVNKIKNFIK